MEPLRLLLVAARFLTRLPLPDVSRDPEDLRRATPAFPLVGLAVAALAAVARAALDPLLGATTASIVAVTVAVIVTGALHEDGLADTADGLFGGYDRARRLEIMRDSRIGTFGAAALLLSLLLRVSLLASVGVVGATRALVAGHVLAQASTLLVVRWVAPADPASSAASVAEPVARPAMFAALAMAGLLVAAATAQLVLLPIGVTVVVTALAGALAQRKLGGITGDVLGATNQLVLVCAMASVVALVRGGLL